MKIGVTGATGQLGRLVVEELKKRVSADAIVALVRTPSKAADMGVESYEFDYNNPDDLVCALAGIDRLLLISSSEIGQRARQHANVVEAAKKAGVKWIVYTSLLHADTSSLSLAEEHRATEKVLKESGIPYTLLRNGWYTENYTGSIPPKEVYEIEVHNRVKETCEATFMGTAKSRQRLKAAGELKSSASPFPEGNWLVTEVKEKEGKYGPYMIDHRCPGEIKVMQRPDNSAGEENG